jgi:hypothetical protein
MAIEIPKDRSITGEEARQAFVFGLEKVLKQKVDPHHLAAALNLSAVTAERTGKEYPPIQIHVPPREIGVGQPTIAQIVARKIAALHPAGTPHGDEFIKSNQDLL